MTKLMTLKNKIGAIVYLILILIVAFITIKLSGHKHSMGILVIGLVGIDLIVLFIGTILWSVKITNSNIFLFFAGFIVMTFATFCWFHSSYPSYYETRSVFWGLNGEIDTIRNK
jgi:hypothetical protein